MRKLGLVRAWWCCCAGVFVLGSACSSDDGSGGNDGGTSMGAVAGAPRAGRAGGGTGGSVRAGSAGIAEAGSSGRAGGGTAGSVEAGSSGTNEAGSGGRPEGGMGGGGQAGACNQEVTNDLIQRTLREYCQDHACPETLEEARQSFLQCNEFEFTEETTGCGYTVLRAGAQLHGNGYVFEGTELVGAYGYGDVLEPPCDTAGEVGGVYPPDCPTADSCRICDNEDGAAGEGPFCDFTSGGGAGGAGGQGGLGSR